jgi:hypothetical protein
MVRQLFEAGVLQSGFGINLPWQRTSSWNASREFGVVKETEAIGTLNNINYKDSTGIDHDKFSLD